MFEEVEIFKAPLNVTEARPGDLGFCLNCLMVYKYGNNGVTMVVDENTLCVDCLKLVEYMRNNVGRLRV